MRRDILKTGLAGLGAAVVPGIAAAQKRYGPGADDKEIKIGGISPYSGPASSYGTIGKGIKAYFDKVNAEGGINGRKLNFISYDDGYNPSRTVEMARKLVEQDEVLFIFNVLGTPTNSAIHKYMNQQKVPQLFNATGATKWGDPKAYPWTIGWQPSYQSEAFIYAQHILDTKPNAKIGIIYQNDDYGRDYLKGFEDGLGDKAKTMIVKKVSYEATDATIDSQMVDLKSSGADTFFNITIPKFAAQAIKKAADIGWKPTHYLNGVSASVGSTIIPAGPENAVGVITAYYLKDPTDSAWQATPEYKDWLAWMQKYYPGGDLKDANNVFAYAVSQSLVEVLKKCGDNLTRENIMRQAANLDHVSPMLLPGVNVKTGPDDFFPIERQQLQRWDGKNWVRFGKVYGR
jgi:branched-chain amino acid transport system substrate-binding protein